MASGSCQGRFVSGILIGGAVGCAAMCLLLGGWSPRTLSASATDRAETFAMATGTVDSGVEAIFTLDFLSGDLNGAVLNPGTRTFTATYHRNIAGDLQVEAGRQPKYALVTGQSYLRTGSNFRLAPCAIYIAELTSGKMAVYTFAFNPTQITRSEMSPPGEFVLLQVVPIRSLPVRQ